MTRVIEKSVERTTNPLRARSHFDPGVSCCWKPKSIERHYKTAIRHSQTAKIARANVI